MDEALAELEMLQIGILRRIANLEPTFLPRRLTTPISLTSCCSNLFREGGGEDAIVVRLSSLLRCNGIRDFTFKRVNSDFYSQTLESRRSILGAASVDHLCKSIVLVNTQASSNVIDCSDRNNSKYYVVVVQYTARFNADTVKKFLHGLNNGKISKKKFNLRLAPDEVSQQLTGYERNAVTCIGMKTNIPVILDEAIVRLNPDFFWFGGGEVDLKLGMRTHEFVDFVKPFVVAVG